MGYQEGEIIDCFILQLQLNSFWLVDYLLFVSALVGVLESGVLNNVLQN